MGEKFDKETEQSTINFETEAEASSFDSVPEKKFNLGKEIFEWIYTIAIALVIAFLIKGFVFDVVKVDGPSMKPTLQHNDRLIITKLGYKPQQGDIIILDSSYKNRTNYFDNLELKSGKDMNWLTKAFTYPSLPSNLKRRFYVKRIIALPGQTVDIQNGKVLVDGKILDEPYIDVETAITDHTVSYPVTVDEDCVFVMGDNRSNSKDSRSSELGQVPIKAIMGKSQVRIFPFHSIGFTK